MFVLLIGLVQQVHFANGGGMASNPPASSSTHDAGLSQATMVCSVSIQGRLEPETYFYTNKVDAATQPPKASGIPFNNLRDSDSEPDDSEMPQTGKEAEDGNESMESAPSGGPSGSQQQVAGTAADSGAGDGNEDDDMSDVRKIIRHSRLAN